MPCSTRCSDPTWHPMSADTGSPGPRSQREIIAALTRVLDASGTPYMLTGSVASSLHGEPRASLDVDVVVDPSKATLGRLVDALLALGWYADADAARDALAERGQFNAIDPASGWKVDLIIRKRRPFSDSEFARRRRMAVHGTDVQVASPEDTIVAKLEWARLGESDRQLRDVVGILRVSAAELDLGYVAGWVERLGLQEMWDRARAMAG